MSIGRELKKLLGAVAPTIATAVGGPVGGVAVKFLADKFTGGDTGKVEDFLLAASPEQLAELKKADKEFQVKMKSLDIDLERLHHEDRQGARQMQKDNKQSMYVQAALSIFYTIAYFYTIFVFLGGHVRLEDQFIGLFQGLLGVLTAAQIQILNFWFGSSRGSKEKTEILSNGKHSEGASQ